MRRVVGAIAVFVVFAVSYKGAQTTVRPSEVLFPSVSALSDRPANYGKRNTSAVHNGGFRAVDLCSHYHHFYHHHDNSQA